MKPELSTQYDTNTVLCAVCDSTCSRIAQVHQHCGRQVYRLYKLTAYNVRYMSCRSGVDKVHEYVRMYIFMEMSSRWHADKSHHVHND